MFWTPNPRDKNERKNTLFFKKKKTIYMYCNVIKIQELINPFPAEVLENQDTLEGGQIDPPSKSHV